MISASELCRLLNYRAEGPSVISLYVDLDPAHDYVREAQSLMQQARVRDKRWDAFESELNALSELLSRPSPPGARGLAVFCSRGRDLWLAAPVPQPLKSGLRLDDRPYLKPLCNVLDQYYRYGIVLLDPEKARFLEVFLGQIQEYPIELEDRQEAKAPAATDALNRRLKLVADRLMCLSRKLSFNRVILAAPPELETALIHHLHTRLQDNLILDPGMNPGFSVEQVLERVLSNEAESQKVRESVLVCRLLDAIKSNRMGVVGLEETLPALHRGEIRMLLVHKGLARMGRTCLHCGALALNGKKCAYCFHDTEPVLNLIEEIIQRALDSNCEVYRISSDPRLDLYGGIGAELRFKTDLADSNGHIHLNSNGTHAQAPTPASSPRLTGSMHPPGHH